MVSGGGMYCAARGCEHNTNKHRYSLPKSPNNVSFFNFPRDEARCQLWAQRSGMAKEKCDRLSLRTLGSFRLCGKHFDRSQFTNDLRIRVNRNRAVPSIFEHKVYQVPPPEDITALLEGRGQAVNGEIVISQQNDLLTDHSKDSDHTYSTHALHDILAGSLPDPISDSKIFSRPTGEHTYVKKISPEVQVDGPRPAPNTDSKILRTPTGERTYLKKMSPKVQDGLLRAPITYSKIVSKPTPEPSNLQEINLLIKVHTAPKCSNAALAIQHSCSDEFDMPVLTTPLVQERRRERNKIQKTGSEPVLKRGPGKPPRERVYPVHKEIIAAKSPVLAAMFDSDRDDQGIQTIDTDLNDNVLCEMLSFVYTGEPGRVRNMLDLLYAAEKYEIKELFTLCETRMYITVDNVAELLIAADKHKAELLKSRAIDFINGNAAAVMTTPGWNQMLQTRPQLLTPLYQAMAARLTGGQAKQNTTATDTRFDSD